MSKLTEQYNQFVGSRIVELCDDKAVPLPKASFLGYGKGSCRKGMYFETFDGKTGRSLGRVKCEGKVYILAIVLFGFDHPCLRWIEPEDVYRCQETIASDGVALFYGEIEDPVKILRRCRWGFSNDEVKRRNPESAAKIERERILEIGI